ncbi:acyltransferase [Dechloromonas agitata]|uniref:acyltransferase family protein n=1 Tax=Dechloromonas agitata TaxID=73030 RepID=UPI00237E8524|nr:acyltransferase [Dechloromonas agitata]MDE1546526.1 acyltransferase [Dechloromonas agitata]
MGVLRFLLAIAVVIAHAGPVFGHYIADGRFAVQMFYMVSGFYMALVWNERYATSDRAFRTFYLSRFLRIYPQYAIVLVLSIAVSGYAWVTQDRHPIAVAQHFSLSKISAGWVYGTQASLLGLESLLFLERAPDGGLAFTSNFADASQPPLHYYVFVPQAWSLGLELMFYLLVPFLLSKTRVIVSIVILSLAARAIAWHQGFSHDPWTYRFFPFEIAMFLAGSLSLRLSQCIPDRCISRIQKPIVHISAMLILIVTIFKFNLLHEALGEASYWLSYLVAFLLLPVVFDASRYSEKDRIIGDLSYPIYISHLMIIWVLYFVYQMPLDGIVYFAIPLSIIFSVLLNKAQARIDVYRHALVRRSNS